MLPSSPRTSQSHSAPTAPSSMPMRRYAHPISVSYHPPAVISEEGIQWIYAALYAQSMALEEIKAMLQGGYKL